MAKGSKPKKGAAARQREKVKGKNQGPKRLGVSKPPPGMVSLSGVPGASKLSSKKAKKAAARAAAYAIIGESIGNKASKKFAY